MGWGEGEGVKEEEGRGTRLDLYLVIYDRLCKLQ